MKYIIDGHSHIGNERFNSREETKCTDYVTFASKCGVNVALIMPVPCPISPLDIGELEPNKTVLSWRFDGNKFEDYSESKIISDRYLKNPYKEINEYYFKEINKSTTENLKLYFIPIIHPRLDSIDYLEELIVKYSPVALKIHSVGTLTSPNEISQDWVRIINKYDMPIIVHTDFNNGKFDSNPALYNAVKKADPLEWYNFFESNQITGVLNHGAALSIETLEKVNKSNYVKVGIGPDEYFGKDFGRLAIDKKTFDEKGFLKILHDVLLPEKLIFDIDFDYNQGQNKKLDFNCINRITGIWNEAESNLILCENIIDHFPKLKLELMVKTK